MMKNAVSIQITDTNNMNNSTYSTSITKVNRIQFSQFYVNIYIQSSVAYRLFLTFQISLFATLSSTTYDDIVHFMEKRGFLLNETIQTLVNHRSIRRYENKPVKKEDLHMIVEAAQAAPSWIHGQQVSIIAVQDETRKEKLAELVGNQVAVKEAPVFFVFCADFYRAKLASEKQQVPLAVTDDVDSLLVGATDVGLAMGNAIAAAESLGLGIVPIGGIRKNPLEVIKLLELPEYVIPISGLCIGYANETPEQKPRLPKEIVYQEEKYNAALQKEKLDTYDQMMSNYTSARTNGENNSNWSERVAAFYSKPYYGQIGDMLLKQKFTCNNMNRS